MEGKRFALIWQTQGGEQCIAFFDKEPKDFEVCNAKDGRVFLMDKLGMAGYYGWKNSKHRGPRLVKEYKNGRG